MKLLLGFCLAVALIYLLICVFVYFRQEKLIFKPTQLPANHQFKFKNKFEELFIKSSDGKLLNGLLFKIEQPKGLIFYLHGNIGSLDSWGEVPKNYINLGYDIFIYDYRSYGKSEGQIKSQQQLFDDNQILYNEMKKIYSENSITILGHSLGSGMAAKLASENQPKSLILITPYYSMSNMVKSLYPYLPVFLLKYKLETYKFLKKCKMPVIIFHGDKDDLVPYDHSVRLMDVLKSDDRLITLKNQDHYRINDSEDYRNALKEVLHELNNENRVLK